LGKDTNSWRRRGGPPGTAGGADGSEDAARGPVSVRVGVDWDGGAEAARGRRGRDGDADRGARRGRGSADAVALPEAEGDEDGVADALPASPEAEGDEDGVADADAWHALSEAGRGSDADADADASRGTTAGASGWGSGSGSGLGRSARLVRGGESLGRGRS
jgi:hypothetical protein